MVFVSTTELLCENKSSGWFVWWQVEGKNRLESYALGVRHALQERGGRLSDSERQLATSTVNETLLWLEAQSNATVEEFQRRYTDLEKIVSPIVSKLHTDSAGPGFSQGPTIEEVD